MKLLIIILAISLAFQITNVITASETEEQETAALIDEVLKATDKGNFKPETPFLDLVDSNGSSLLYIAAGRGLNKIVVKILKYKPALIDKKNNNDFTPLHAAAGEGYTNVIEILLINGASLNPQSITGLTPLHLAARNNKGDAFLLLLQAGANPTLVTLPFAAQSEKNAFTINPELAKEHAVEIAAYNGDLTIVNKALTQPIDVAHIKKAIQLAAIQEKNEIVQRLLQYSNLSKEELGELLIFAAKKANTNLTKTLLDNDGFIDKSTLSQALNEAVKTTNQPTVKLLLDIGAPITDGSQTIESDLQNPDLRASYKQRLTAIKEIIDSMRPSAATSLAGLFAQNPLAAPGAFSTTAGTSSRIRPSMMKRTVSEKKIIQRTSSTSAAFPSGSPTASADSSRSASPTGS